MLRSGGRILVDALMQNGADVVFGVPGESYLSALDAFHDSANALKYVTMRQEGGAALAAAAWSDLTGRPGICFVTRGPGVTNASIALHTAMQGSTPLILLIGQIKRGHRDREAFQEIDYRRFLSPVVKLVAEVDDPARLPEYVNRAFQVALSGRPGPVALALPEDMLFDTADVDDIQPTHRPAPAPGPEDMQAISDMLAEAERPLLLLGGTCWTTRGHTAIKRFAEAHALPVAVGFRRQGLFPGDHPNAVGNMGFGGIPEPNRYASEADLILSLGGRLNDPTTLKFSVLKSPDPAGKLVQIYPEAAEIGRIYKPNRAIVADPNSAACALVDLPVRKRHTAALSAAKDSFEAAVTLAPQPGPIDMAEVMRCLNARLPRETSMTTGAGNASDWPNVHYRYRQFLGSAAPISGAMGMGVPAAVAAKIARPDAPAVYMGGDGDFLMNGQELATAVQYGLDPVFIIVDNGKYGTIRGNQEARYPGRSIGTDLKNPDFAAVAEGYGALGRTVRETADFAPALEDALTAGRAAVLHLLVGEDHLGPNNQLGD